MTYYMATYRPSDYGRWEGGSNNARWRKARGVKSLCRHLARLGATDCWAMR